METAKRVNPGITGPTFIIASLFFVFGFVTWLNSTLIPYLKIACELDDRASMLVAFAFYISYFFTAIPSSWVLSKTGFKNGMVLGLLIMAVGSLVFIPAATTRTYSLFLTGLFITGTGLSLLQTAVNPYVTIVGPIESAARRISIMGICNKFAGVLAPLIMGAVILKNAEGLTKDLSLLDGVERAQFLDELALRVVVPYIIMTLVLIVLAMLIFYSKLPSIEAEEEVSSTRSEGILSHPNLVLGVIALFLYVGAEVIAGDTIGLLGQELNISLAEAKNFPAYTLTAMVAGYLIGIAAIPKYISQAKALALSAIAGIVLTSGAVMLSGYSAVMCIALLGLANALVWPAIWPLALEGLGRLTKTGSAMLIMAIAGGAVLPVVYGHFADMENVGRQGAYLILIPCYLFILYYSLHGHTLRLRKKF